MASEHGTAREIIVPKAREVKSGLAKHPCEAGDLGSFSSHIMLESSRISDTREHAFSPSFSEKPPLS